MNEGIDRSRRRAVTALVLIGPAQSLGVAAMLLALPGPLGLGINLLSRAWMVAFPLFWAVRIERVRLPFGKPSRAGLMLGLATGVVILLVMLGAYALIADRVDLPSLRSRARQTGFDDPFQFAAMFGFIILLNSLLEEFVWRWFVYRQLETLTPARWGWEARQGMAVALAALAFTVHHVVALSAWVDGGLVVLGSLGVFLGAVVWSALFAYDRTLWPCYVSHIFADVAIVIIGYDVLFRMTM
ncbi:CPBP family intramembrane glutamic endopeptidase [Tautonia sp. JC769]|uniref:CPBP family intramembrane glutamic endopeptidase n=1 Tax=Tautonia sp. JC769 TaxID=3232135 RepID=UPI003459C73C